MKNPFALPKGIVLALDMTELSRAKMVVEATKDIKGVVGYKIGGLLAEQNGLPRVVEVLRNETGKHLIYDRQKGATDIPDVGHQFAKLYKSAGVDSVILFPLSGPVTQEAWTKALWDEELIVWVGGHMTHKGYLWDLETEHCGYIHHDSPERIYGKAATMGVRYFIVPGNNPEMVNHYRNFIAEIMGCGDFTLGAPGFVEQGGKISDAAQAAGHKWVAIVGRAIILKPTVEEMRAAALEQVAQL